MMKKYIVYGLLVVSVIAVGIFIVLNNAKTTAMNKDAVMEKPTSAIAKDEKTASSEAMMEIGTETMMDDTKDTSMEKTDDTTMKNDVEDIQYSGKILAGTTTPYIVFNQPDYTKAKKEGKTILLSFYANWCPICRAEAPELNKGFDMLTAENVVAFRVNFKDSDTDKTEESLAKEFKIPYQHTKVIIKNGTVVLKDGNQWDSTTLVENVTAALR
ncbi:MAG: thioredoxin family protein [Candidatus Roizmanbacteria bacterium]|nr:thioredoxin family protein [Candidatus Roizmanbacteria bacterium]